MSTCTDGGDCGTGINGGLGNARSIECELVRRNREIAQIRDLLRQREGQVEDWKGRHGDLVGRLADLDGELTKLRMRTREIESRRRIEDACKAQPVVPPNAALEAGPCHAALEVAEGKLAQEQRRVAEVMREVEAAREEAQESRRRAENAENANEQKAEADVAAALADIEFSKQMAVLEEKVCLERDARLEVEAQLAGVEKERDDALAELSKVSAELRDAKARIDSAARMRDEIAEQMTNVAGELHDAKTRYSTAACERKDALLELQQAQKQLARCAHELEASKESGLSHSLQATANEIRLKDELCLAEERRDTAERELVVLKRAPPQVVPSRLEAKARILQAENDALRADAAVARRRQRELCEGIAMSSEETRSRQVEAAIAVAEANDRESLLKVSLEETRRARSVEMTALVKKLCKPGSALPDELLWRSARPEELLKSARPGGG